ncbi:MAG TPA: S24 family peptidase [Candidatus Saccharimonadales bacterium]|nr:S24 family peptidase [Candidatus Saccharimonadales bacterium]
MEEDLEALAGSDGVSIHTGFPNPAIERAGQGRRLALDLNQLLIRHPSSTYLLRISGHQWADQGVFDGDIAVIDRALVPSKFDLVVAWEEAGFALYRYLALNHSQKPWGVVTAIVHQYQT